MLLCRLSTLHARGDLALPLLMLLVNAQWNASPATAGEPCTPVWSDQFPSGEIYKVYCQIVFNEELYVGGEIYDAGGFRVNHIAKWDGARWSPLGSGLPNMIVSCMAIFNNELYVGGRFKGPALTNCLAKWNQSTWSAINYSQSVDTSSMAVFGGHLYVAGSFPAEQPGATPGLMKWTGAGWQAVLPTDDSQLSLNPMITALAVFGNSLYAGGFFLVNDPARDSQSPPSFSIARWNGAWHALDEGVQGHVSELLVHNQRLYVGGNILTAGEAAVQGIAQWTGTSWLSVAPLEGSCSALGRFGNSLYAVDAVGSSGARVRRLDGLWTTVGTTQSNYDAIHSLIEFDGKLYASGQQNAIIDPQNEHRVNGAVSTWDGSVWAPIGSGLRGSPRAMVQDNKAPGFQVYVGGSLVLPSGQSVAVASWNGTTWSAIGEGLSSGVYALQFYGEAESRALYACGHMTLNGVPGYTVAKWTGSQWMPVSTPDSVGWAYTMAVLHEGSRTKLFVGGDFQRIGDVPANRVAQWDGSAWSAVGAGLGSEDDYGAPFALSEFNGTIVAGGDFMTAEGRPAMNVARWDGCHWTPMGAGLGVAFDSVYAFAVFRGELYAAGGFSFNGLYNNLAKWTGATWLPVGPELDHYILSLAVADDGAGSALYMAGQIRQIGNVPVSNLAKWDGETFSSVAGGTTERIFTLLAAHAVGQEDRIYVAGDFRAVNEGKLSSGHFGEVTGCAIPIAPAPYPADSDQDGIPDEWEVNGVDGDGDGEPDLDLARYGADPMHKDIFVELDAMQGLGPTPCSMGDVKRAFERAPGALVGNPRGEDGIALHLLVSETDLPLTPWPAWKDSNGDGTPDWPQGFDDAKLAHFGDPADSLATVAAKRLVYRYCIFSHSFGSAGNSGIAEVSGNDFTVSLGLYTGSDRVRVEAGTFMHELGHTLGLQHGGGQVPLPTEPQRFNYKPNYRSVMNYTWQFPQPGYSVSWELDYSREVLRDLDENCLDEASGIGGRLRAFVRVGPPPADIVHEYGHIDWNRDNSNTDLCVQADVNHVSPSDLPSPGDVLRGFADWNALTFDFTSSPDFADGIHIFSTTDTEMTWATYAFLQSLGPLCPADLDADDDVDQDDLALFTPCTTGPHVPYLGPDNLPAACGLELHVNGWIKADIDRDNDVDMSDFGLFQRCYSGSNVNADPHCAD